MLRDFAQTKVFNGPISQFLGVCPWLEVKTNIKYFEQ